MDLLIPAFNVFWILFFAGIIVVLPLWALFSVLKSTFEDTTVKLIWTIVVIFVPVVGSMFYFSLGVKQKVNTTTIKVP